MTSSPARRHDSFAALRVGEIRLMLLASGCAGLANRALAVVVGYQVYALTKSPLMLGLLGLIEAIPAISLSLYGGHVADRSDRRTIIVATRTVSFICAVGFALISLDSQASSPPASRAASTIPHRSRSRRRWCRSS